MASKPMLFIFYAILLNIVYYFIMLTKVLIKTTLYITRGCTIGGFFKVLKEGEEG